jgi:hypothetical protein
MTVYIFSMVEDATDNLGVNYTPKEFAALAKLKMSLPKRRKMKEILIKKVNVSNAVNVTNDFVRQIEPSAYRFEIQQ